MRCRNCDYLLFNLTGRECPECGRAFDVADYHFAPGEVSFHCPHCDQAYLGNDEYGLPSPRRFRCAKCGQEVSLNELRVVPERGGADGRIGSAWDNRRHYGLVSAWWSTFKETLTQPTTFYREHVGQSIGEAWLFSMIASYIGMVPAMIVQTLIAWGFMKGALAIGAIPGASVAPPIAFFALFYGLLALVMPPLMPFIVGGFYALTTQLALLVLVPQRQPFSATLRTAMYSMSAYALYAVPICGGYVGGIWQLVIYVNGIKEVHHTNGWIAAIAALWPIFALTCLYVLIIVMVIGLNLV